MNSTAYTCGQNVLLLSEYVILGELGKRRVVLGQQRHDVLRRHVGYREQVHPQIVTTTSGLERPAMTEIARLYLCEKLAI